MNLTILVGNRIKAIRKEKGLTQEQLAEAASIQYSYIGGIERGDRNITMETLEKVIAALNVDPIELFRFDLQDSDDVAKREAMDLLVAKLSLLPYAELRAMLRIIDTVMITWKDLKENG